MRIGFVFDDSLDAPDGVQQYLLTLTTWLVDRGHEVSFLVGETHRSDIEKIYSLSKNWKVRFNGNRLSIPLPAKEKLIQSVFDDRDFDVIHVQSPYSPFMAGRVLREAHKRNIPIVSTFHILPYSPIVTAANYLLAAATSRTRKYIKISVAGSAPAADFANRVYNLTCRVLPHPVDLWRFMNTRPVIAGSMPRIVFLGRLVERKGAMHLLKALAYIKFNNLIDSDFEVIMAGKGPDLAKLEVFSKEHGLDVAFPGFIAEEDKPGLLASADICIFPSISGESFGISVVEGLAAARGVVLAGNNPGYSSVMDGLRRQLVDPLNTESFAETIVSWLKDAKKRSLAGKKQKKYALQFSIEKVGLEMETIYQSVLQSGS